jgi:hypothetical protein
MELKCKNNYNINNIYEFVKNTPKNLKKSVQVYQNEF